MGKKLSERERARRAARRIEARRRAELGPLFADQAEPVDEHRLMIERRLGWARQCEHLREVLDGNHVLNALYAGQLEALARRFIPGTVVDRLAADMRDRGPDSRVSAWLAVLRGERRVLSFKEVPGPMRWSGRLMAEDEAWPPQGWTPPFTKADMDTMFWWKCRACGLYHAPGQATCGPPARDEDDEVMAALAAAIRGGAT